MKPTAFIHLDLDGLWTLARCYGYEEGDSFERDLVFETGLPRLMKLLEELDLRITFFISGRDLQHPPKAQWIRRLAEAGHELANHGWDHDFNYESWDLAALTDEFQRTNQSIQTIAGRPPVGFRAPGYAAGPRVMAAVSRAGLRYDASILPTPWAPLLRRLAGSLRRRVRQELGLAAQTAPTDWQYSRGESPKLVWYEPPGEGNRVVRLPLAVSPVMRLPLHASLGMLLGARMVRRGLRSLARGKTPITYLLHGLDTVGFEDLRGHLPRALLSSRGFRFPLQAKLDFLHQVLSELKTIADVQLTCNWLETVYPVLPESS